jgi:DNA-binding MarR family transcriptional regulator
MSTPPRENRENREKSAALVAEIGRLVMRWQDATQEFDDAVGRRHDLNAADRRCLALISGGPRSATEIAAETALAAASVTSLIDRLEARKLVRRLPDPRDRRRVLVEATEKARKLIAAHYLPIATAGAEMLSAYSAADLEAVRRFVSDALALQERMTAEQFGGAAGGPAGDRHR